MQPFIELGATVNESELRVDLPNGSRIRLYGADNYDHQAIRLIAGLRQGQPITLPSQQISTAIKNLWAEGLFSNISIYAEKEIAGVVYLIIDLRPRPKLSRFKFKADIKKRGR